MDLRVNRRTVQQEVVEKLREAILIGVFRPGDRLVEANLCASLGVSRQSLREGLRILQAEHLVEIVPNRGPQIPVLSWEAAEEIYDVRALLEGEAAARCVSLIVEDDLRSLWESLERFRTAVKEKAQLDQVRHTAEFYAVILRCCGNKTIEQIISGLFARINFLRSRSMSLPGRTKNSLNEMTAIFFAIKARDVKAARKAAQLHVSNAKEAARRAYSHPRNKTLIGSIDAISKIANR
jgi:DNA-binding GntR family transcriptional regulator